jgi:hypothetical protein
MQFGGTENLGLTSIANYINLFIVNANFPSTGAILIQLGISLLGSLIASAIIAWFSEKRFNQAMKKSQAMVTGALDSIDEKVSTIAQKTDRLPELVPIVSVIGDGIKRLAEVVDKIREGLEKTK